MTTISKSLSRTLLAAAIVGAGFTGVAATTSTPVLADPVQLDAPSIPGFADVVEAVSPAVVSVRVKSNVRPVSDQRGQFNFDPRGDFEDQMRRFFGPRDRFENRNRKRGERFQRARPISQGSGFFISDDGFVVTNSHVIDNGTEFSVVLNDGTELDAQLIGKDRRTDLAVLKVDDDRTFTYVTFADESDVRIGDWVVAVGNPFGLGGTVTAGILSARGRDIGAGPYDDFLQIDAAVNRGNSGGPTFGLNGEVVGINTAIFSPSGGNVGIAFAVPASLAEEVIADLMDDGSVERGWLGVAIQPVTEQIAESLGLDQTTGALVSDPQEESPAAEAGIRAGDIITGVNGDEVESPRELSRMIADIDPGSDVEITINRNGETSDIKVKLGELPADQSASLDEPAQPADPAVLEDFGLTIIPNDEGEGLVVTAVEPGSDASEAGIRVGDVIAEINNQKVSELADVQERLDEIKADGRKAALLRLESNDRSRFVALPLA